MQSQFTLNTSQSILTWGMQQESEPKNFRTLISLLEDFLVKHSVSQGNEEDLMTQEELSFLKSQGFSKTKDPNIFYSKMFKVYYLTTREKLSRQSLGFSPTWGIQLHGRCLTAKTSVPHKNRRRIYIIGYLGRKCGGEIFLESGTNKSTNSQVDYLIDNGRGKKIINPNTLTQTLTASGSNGGHNTFVPSCIQHNFTSKVHKRKYSVDTEKLKLVLREAKKDSNFTNQELSDKLNVSKTCVDHWFRNDNCFSIPDKNIWLNLKDLLNISTTMFDKSIMEFETIDGVYDRSNRAYDENGLSPTITASSGELVKVNEPCIKKVGNVHPSGKGMSGEVYDTTGLSPTITTNNGEGVKVKVNQNIKRLGNIYPSGYCTGTIYDHNGVSPTLTCSHSQSVNIQVGTKKGYQEAKPGDGITLTRPGCKTRRGRVSKQSSNTLLTDKNLGTLTSDFRIRRLTPIECERLQGFPDNWTQYGIDDEEISNTQRYKCCGNAVTTNVITYLINSIWDNLS